MGLWSRMLDMVLGGQSEAGNRSYVFVLPTAEEQQSDPEDRLPRKKGYWEQ